MEGDATMPSEGFSHPGEIHHDAYASSSKAFDKGKGREQPGIRVVPQPEQLENPHQPREQRDVAEPPRTSPQPWQAESTKPDDDLHAMQDYVSRLPDALVSELAILLAQRMKQQIRNSDKSSSTRGGPADSSSSRMVVNSQTGEHVAARLFGRLEQSEGMAVMRYIVTPHLDQPGRSIRHWIGEPEVVAYLPPGLYRENGDGVMELENSFRRSWVVEAGGGAEGDGGVVVARPGAVVVVEPGWLRKMMSRVFRKPTMA